VTDNPKTIFYLKSELKEKLLALKTGELTEMSFSGLVRSAIREFITSREAKRNPETSTF